MVYCAYQFTASCLLHLWCVVAVGAVVGCAMYMIVLKALLQGGA